MRRLVAIMFQDIPIDEGDKRLAELRQKLKLLVQQHNGELIKHRDSSYISSFESAVDALSCAIELNNRSADESILKSRIGIHIGDLLYENGNALGNGIDGAAKVCQMAGTGSVCISGRVFRSRRFQQALTERNDWEANPTGKVVLNENNDSDTVYTITDRSKLSADSKTNPLIRGYSRAPKVMVGVGLLLVVSLGIWWLMSAGSPNRANPSVAVLPFEDFSQKGNQQWFSDGLTEEVLNSLVRLEGLYVPARTSSFAFKGKNIPIQQIADSLNVDHIVEGSVRRFNGRMRISVQLIEANTGGHLWSKTYDRPTDSVFAVQKNIAEKIASTLDVYLDEQKRDRMFTFGTQNVQAYEAFLKGENIYYKAHQNHEIPLSRLWKANQWYNKAIRLDSSFAFPYQQRTDAYYHFFSGQIAAQADTLSREGAYEHIIADFNKSIRYSNNSGNRLFYRFNKLFFTDNWELIPKLARSIHNNPDAYQSFVLTGGGAFPTGFIGVGYPSLAHRLFKEKLKHDPLNNLYKSFDILALQSMDQAGKALKIYQDYLEKAPLRKAMLLMFDGQVEEAKSLLTRLDHEKTLANLLKGLKLWLGIEHMNKQELQSYFDQQEIPRLENFLYFAAGYPEAANRAAGRVDSTMLGCKKLLPLAFGNIFVFDLRATPNLARCLDRAAIKTESYTLAGRKVRRIVPKGL